MYEDLLCCIFSLYICCTLTSLTEGPMETYPSVCQSVRDDEFMMMNCFLLYG